MIWDFVVAYVAFTFTIAGWNLGTLNSWRAAIAIICATLLSQALYLDCSAWIMDQSGLPADTSVFVGYATTWLFCCALTEALLFAICPSQTRGKLRTLNKLGGSAIWLTKGCALLLFATIASLWSADIPIVPQRPEIAAFVAQSSHQSLALNQLRRLSVQLPAPVVERVVCVSPSVLRNGTPETAVESQSLENKRVREIMENLRQLQDEAEGTL